MSAPRSYSPYPRTPYGLIPLDGWKFPARKSEWRFAIPPAPLGLAWLKFRMVWFHRRAWICRTNAPGPISAVGAAHRAARKPSPSKGEGVWPKARRMRVLS